MRKELVRGEMNIVQMRSDHVCQVAELEAACFSDPWNQESVASELENPLSLWIVAEENGEVLGYVGSQTVLGETDMMNLAVRPDCRRRGLAERMVNALITQLKGLGSHCLTLEVRQSNLPARNLYEKLGFQQVGLRKNYYYHPKENALILRKEWEI